MQSKEHLESGGCGGRWSLERIWRGLILWQLHTETVWLRSEVEPAAHRLLLQSVNVADT